MMNNLSFHFLNTVAVPAAAPVALAPPPPVEMTAGNRAVATATPLPVAPSPSLTPAMAVALTGPAAASFPSPLDPFIAMSAFASGTLTFEEFLRSIPAVNASLEVNRLDFPRLKLTPFDGLDAAFREELQALAARLAGATEDARRKRICDLYFLFWLSLHALNVDHEPEAEWWQERLAAACCTVDLNSVSACIRLLAGQFADDRDAFLARLRPCFQQTLARLGARSASCGCTEGLG